MTYPNGAHSNREIIFEEFQPCIGYVIAIRDIVYLNVTERRTDD